MSLRGRADVWMLEQVESVRGGVLDDAFLALSGLPLRLALLAAGLVAVSALARSVRPAVAAAIALAVTSRFTALVKALVDRERPWIADPSLSPLGDLPSSASFPSGHASTAFAVATALALFVPVRWRLALLLPAAAIAFSRIWLGVHYPTDVLAGALLGAAIGYACGALARRAGQGIAVT